MPLFLIRVARKNSVKQPNHVSKLGLSEVILNRWRNKLKIEQAKWNKTLNKQQENYYMFQENLREAVI